METSAARASWNKYIVSNDEAIAMIQMLREAPKESKGKIQSHIVLKLSYMVYSRLNKYGGHWKDLVQEHYEDLVQEGRMGIVKACEKFDFQRGQNFFSYSKWHIQNNLREYLKAQAKIMEDAGGLDLRIESFFDMRNECEWKEVRSALLTAIGRLTEEERKVVEMRFGMDGDGERTYQQIGDVFSFSRQRAEQITLRAIEKLRKNQIVKELI